MGPYSSVQALFEDFNRLKVVVVGDVMVDAYLWGKVDRISPEAPVPIVAVHQKEQRLGGAANVAINIQAMGARPFLCSVIGKDSSGEELVKIMQQQGMNTRCMVMSEERVTTVKTRVIGNNHQLLRVDEEVIAPLKEKERDALLNSILLLLDEEKPHVLIFEDYDKGVLGEQLIHALVKACKERNIPTAVDPKKNNFMAYREVNLFKPNLAELKAGLKTDLVKTDAAKLESITRSFRYDQQIGMLMVTLSEAGVFYSDADQHAIVPAHIRNISDVSGAGDTVISVASLCLALNLPPAIIAGLSNLAGGLVCEKVGVVPIDKQQLLEEASNIAL